MQAHRCQSLHHDICIIEHKGRRVRVQQETIITDFPKSPVLCRLDITRPAMACHHPTLWVKLHLKRPEAPPIDRGRHTDGQLSAIDNSSPPLEREPSDEVYIISLSSNIDFRESACCGLERHVVPKDIWKHFVFLESVWTEKLWSWLRVNFRSFVSGDAG